MVADCHMHMILDGVDWKNAIRRHENGPDIPWIRAQLAIYQSQGYTYLRDGGDRWGAGAAARAIAHEYGIEYRTPLAPLCQEGHYGGFIGLTYRNMGEYAQLVQGMIDGEWIATCRMPAGPMWASAPTKGELTGADFIKIMISGLMDFHQFGKLTLPSLPSDHIRELIHIAHDMGMAVMAHANGPEAVIAAAEAGVDSVEHGAYLNEEALSAMAENGVVWVPTVSTVANLRGKDRFPEDQVEKILECNLSNVVAFHEMGGLLAPGSDAGAWSVPHGANTEYDLLTGVGVTEAALDRGAAVIQRKFKREDAI